MSEMKSSVNENEMNHIAGGSVVPDEIHNLKNFVNRTVVGLPSGTCLQMQSCPDGPFLPVMYYEGNNIFVNAFFMQEGYLLAFKDGMYGFVDGGYVR